jgi:hypothetical protein
MTADPDDALTREEFASLGQLAKGPLATEVPPEHILKLSKLGLIAKVRSEYMLTEAGLRQLEISNAGAFARRSSHPADDLSGWIKLGCPRHHSAWLDLPDYRHC